LVRDDYATGAQSFKKDGNRLDVRRGITSVAEDEGKLAWKLDWNGLAMDNDRRTQWVLLKNVVWIAIVVLRDSLGGARHRPLKGINQMKRLA
jgi:hypothetical protein